MQPCFKPTENPRRVSSSYSTLLNFEDIKLSIKLNHKFENLNNISLNIFAIETTRK